MPDDLHLHIMDHMNDCIRGILYAVADDLRAKAKNMQETGLDKELTAADGLETAALDIANLSNEFK